MTIMMFPLMKKCTPRVWWINELFFPNLIVNFRVNFCAQLVFPSQKERIAISGLSSPPANIHKERRCCCCCGWPEKNNGRERAVE